MLDPSRVVLLESGYLFKEPGAPFVVEELRRDPSRLLQQPFLELDECQLLAGRIDLIVDGNTILDRLGFFLG